MSDSLLEHSLYYVHGESGCGVTSEQAFVSDITYVESEEGVHYLSRVTDEGSREIMGHELSREMEASDVIKALRRAIGQRCRDTPLSHHSEQGIRYCSQL